jgi:DNA polymerase III subunit epsilon
MYAIVDIETTGGYAENHRITEIAVMWHDGLQAEKSYRTLVNPQRPIPPYITGLTGITNEMVLSAPRFEEIAQELLPWLTDKVFVAHNAHFDYSFLKKEFEQVGINWQTKKLCTVRLGRKIIPGLRSYSLGSISESLGIHIDNRHRAGGDAEATVKVFSQLLYRDSQGYIAKALKRNSGETILPPNLPKQEFDTLPAKPGVYYFLNARRSVIYVGKAANIKKRIAGHFAGDAREWSKQNIRNEIHHIRYELTGNEMIALIFESQEIRRLWPKYNQAQKHRVEEWGIYAYEDRNGYQRFSINTVMRGTQPLVRLSNKGDAWNFLWEKVRAFDLCPKLCGLQATKGLCFQHQTGECRGACQEIESAKKYNKRIVSMLETIKQKSESLAIVGQGRSNAEQSLILVKEGNYVGHGFIDRKNTFTNFIEAQKFVKIGVETPTVHNIINSYLANPKAEELLIF